MKTGECRLCKNHGDLEESHIVPKFVYRWLKKTAATGHLRPGATPNMRVQDGFKFYLLCPNCEDMFSKWETEFANKVFYPQVQRNIPEFEYGEWLLKFAVSVSWRSLCYVRELDSLKHFSTNMREKADGALNEWGKFLLGEPSSILSYPHHFIPLSEVGGSTGVDMPRNINRYFMRAVDIDPVSSNSQSFIYVKIPQMAIVGEIFLENDSAWNNTQINLERGSYSISNYNVPTDVFKYILGKAQMTHEAMATISDKQMRKINESVLGDIDETRMSGTFTAIKADVNLFGKDALSRDKN